MGFSRVAAASVMFAVVVLAGPTSAVAAPGDPTPSPVVSSAQASTPAATPAVPGIQTPAPGNEQTPPAAPAAPGEPVPWTIVVFGVLGIALLIVWAVLTRRARDAEGKAGETDDGGDRA